MNRRARTATTWRSLSALVVVMCCSLSCATPAFPPEDDAGALELDAGTDEDAGLTEEDAGTELDAGLPLDAGSRLDAGRPDAGARADGGSPQDGGALDAGVMDAGAVVDAGPIDAGTLDAGPPSCTLDAGVLGTRCGATKIYESTEGTGPSAFDFSAGRALFLASEVSPVLGDLYVLSAELAPSMPGALTDLALVSPRDSAASGGERGVFRQTGIEDLTALGGGIDNPATFSAIPSSLILRPGTRDGSHRVLAVAGHIYALELAQGSDGGTTFAALYIDRIVTPTGDGGVRRQTLEARWLHQSRAGRRTFERPFPP